MKSPCLLVSDKKGRIFDIPDLEPVGMKAGYFFRLPKNELIKLPFGSRVFMLPKRRAVGYDSKTGRFKILRDYFAVSAFVSPGFTVSYNSAYKEVDNFGILPLFSYAAAGFYKGEIYGTAIRVDRQNRHNPKFIDINQVRKNVVRLKKVFSGNRLVAHLADCALVYGCPGAQNFFLSKYECPLPVSPFCNCSCVGCISFQPSKKISATQPRIKFVPFPEEIRDVALFHIDRVKDPVLSFGQGCEGEPLLKAGVIEQSIRLIRKNTSNGTININTNASIPKAMAKLFDAGLDSIRVSLNSVRKQYYDRYYRPRSYSFKDVLTSIKIARRKNGFVSVNYLTMPGFTDSRDEFYAFKDFIEGCNIDMVQWRNLNFDPLAYFRIIKADIDRQGIIGIRQIIGLLKRDCPNLKMGYYNPH